VLKIKSSFDEELGPGGMDPLGRFVISDEKSTISIDTTYLDSWFSALIDALQRLRTRNHVTVETEEPNTLEIEKAPDGGITFSYQGQSVAAKNTREAELALRAAVSPFLDALKSCPDAAENRLLDPIRRFWATTEN
jgi:hypothetical protein